MRERHRRRIERATPASEALSTKVEAFRKKIQKQETQLEALKKEYETKLIPSLMQFGLGEYPTTEALMDARQSVAHVVRDLRVYIIDLADYVESEEML